MSERTEAQTVEAWATAIVDIWQYCPAHAKFLAARLVRDAHDVEAKLQAIAAVNLTCRGRHEKATRSAVLAEAERLKQAAFDLYDSGSHEGLEHCPGAMAFMDQPPMRIDDDTAPIAQNAPTSHAKH